MRKLRSYPLHYEWRQDWPQKLIKVAEKKKGRPIKYLELKDFEHTGSVLSNPEEARK